MNSHYTDRLISHGKGSGQYNTCALLIVDELQDGRTGDLVVAGHIFGEGRELIFQIGRKVSFRIPRMWQRNLFAAHPERQGLLRGCSSYLVVSRTEIEERSPVPQVLGEIPSWSMPH